MVNVDHRVSLGGEENHDVNHDKEEIYCNGEVELHCDALEEIFFHAGLYSWTKSIPKNNKYMSQKCKGFQRKRDKNTTAQPLLSITKCK